LNDATYKVNCANWREDCIVHADKLRPHFSQDELQEMIDQPPAPRQRRKRAVVDTTSVVQCMSLIHSDYCDLQIDISCVQSQKASNSSASRKRHRRDFSRQFPPFADDEPVPKQYKLYGRDRDADPLPPIDSIDVRQTCGKTFNYPCPSPSCPRRSCDTEWLFTHLFEHHGYKKTVVETTYRKFF
jgi:hypothetical protein